MATPTGAVVYVDPALGIKDASELAKLKGKKLKFGSQRAASMDLVGLLAFDMLDLDIHAIFGMKGRGSARLSFERGEVDIDFQTTSAYLKKVQPLEPGIPINTEVNVSEVGITATKPMSIASAETGSIPYKNGSNSDKPAIPPKPGNMPISKPKKTPPHKYNKCVGVRIVCSAIKNASNILLSLS